MKASVRWLNSYLSAGNLSADEIAHNLTFAGFPIDSRETLPSGDTQLEVELTSNRGDCLSHLGLARELAAKSNGSQTLKPPEIQAPKTHGHVSDLLSLTNEVPESCPRFTAQIVRSVKIAPSPAWLAERLESVGQRPINNVVDATNFLNFEFGQPCHAFDLNKLAARKLIVRAAREGEPLTTLDGKKRTLKAGEIVVADGAAAQSLAGVIGGQDSEVSATTTEIVLEAATWDPHAIRRAARRLQIRTDASHRFERYVDPRTIDTPARRLLALVVELTGGTACAGMLDSASPSALSAPLRETCLRVNRVRTILGIDLSADEITKALTPLDIQVRPDLNAAKDFGPVLLCTTPANRPDLEREIDLIEELARIRGLENIPTHHRITVNIRPPQAREEASRLLGETLAAHGFYETVTFSFLPDAAAKPFLTPGTSLLHVSDNRRQHESALRPSLLPSLLLCRKKNQDGKVNAGTGGLRLFEAASTYAEGAPTLRGGSSSSPSLERRTLTLLMDIPGVPPGKPGTLEERQHALRILRGALESTVRALGGGSASLEVRPSHPNRPVFDPAAHGEVHIGPMGPIGHMGLIDAVTQRHFGLEIPVAAAELDLDPLLALYPARSRVSELPSFPAIDRDLSLILDDATPWSAVRTLVDSANLALLESTAFVGTFRGKQIGDGKKSLTLRLTFRDPQRTLRHEEVDPQVATLISLASTALAATVRT